MRVVVDLNRCQDHGQCVFAAPGVFWLENSLQGFRSKTTADSYESNEISEDLSDDVEDAADACPVQAIRITS